MCASPVHRLLVVTIRGSAKTLGSIRIFYLNVRSRELLSFPARTTFWRGSGHFWTTTYRIRCETYLALLTYLFHVDPIEDVSGFFHLLLRGEAAAVMKPLHRMQSCLPQRFAASVA